MNWSIKEIEALEWLVERNASFQVLENVLYERTPGAIFNKIKRLNYINPKKYVNEYFQKQEVKDKQKEYHQKPEVIDRMKKYYEIHKNEIKKNQNKYRQKPEVKQEMKDYYHSRILSDDLERLIAACKKLNLSFDEVILAKDIYFDLREKNVSFKGIPWAYSIVYYASILNLTPQFIKDVAKFAGVKPFLILRVTEKYKKLYSENKP
ncbi:MAG: hypothetical protein WC376_05940 [Candidatus Nanoarchaeia archaeon]|jgi:transcription initiation factor TFIIIB Brf1 subunit/transcription initiation factor TFIIB